MTEGRPDDDHQAALDQTGYWGKQAAGAMFVSLDTKKLGLALRSGQVLEPHTYGTVGGAIDPDEDPKEAVARELMEEIGYRLQPGDRIEPLDIFQDKTFRYTTFLVIVQKEFHPRRFNWENEGFVWTPIGQWPQPLHPGVAKTLSKPPIIAKLKQAISMMEAYTRQNKWLLDYMKAKEIDIYQFWNEFTEWVFEDEDRAEIVRATLGMSDLNQDNLLEQEPEAFFNLPPEMQKEFIDYAENHLISKMMQHDPVEAPTWAHANLQRQMLLPRDTWLIHFTDHPWDIQSKGFQIGVDDMTRLGLTTYFKNDGFSKKSGGYNFAFLAGSRHASNAARGQRFGRTPKYGKHAVMFQSSGVHTYHYGDEEDQVIFWGQDVDPRGIIALHHEGGDWAVMPHIKHQRRQTTTKRQRQPGQISKENGLYSTHAPEYGMDTPATQKWEERSFDDAEAWVMHNWRQYAKVLTGY